jgi:hypothetical protein
MVEPLRHRQTKGAETDMFDLKKPRHISTLPWAAFAATFAARPVYLSQLSIYCIAQVGRPGPKADLDR